ncbi:TetR/AcrR family transcriptional regulator [Williamsia herbipolensis]|uniref:TetR/AcrR family transcriptional regulator n=1 Tax=Williamsia herbipolensis TaxID=1603258 RepID=A0AAU4JWW8_9NOCA|nr:helix-turn-helix domain-containing protein [Williamsia herbipolensis]
MPPTRRAERRTDALSTDRIVEEAVAILDVDGAAGLTFRALATRLNTGAGAIYHHVANKDELLGAATSVVVEPVVSSVVDEDDPARAIRTVAVGMFDAIDAHPWVGGQLPREAGQESLMRFFESIGSRVVTLGALSSREAFDATSALVNYVLGVAGQNAENAQTARTRTHLGDRATQLAAMADRWTDLDPVEFPFVRQMAAALRDHDDRDQFLAGIDLILAGIEARRRDD